MDHRPILVLLVLLSFVACTQDPVAVGPVRETIDRAGGTVATSDADGRRFVLTVPADAVTETTEITLTPLPPNADEYLRFELAPAGLAFATPASFRVTLPEGTTPDADAQLYFGSLDGDFDALPTTVDPQARTLTAEVALLGADRGPPVSLQADADPVGADGGAAPSTLVCDAQLTLMASALEELFASSGTLFPAAEVVIDTMQDVLLACQGSQAILDFAVEQRPPVEDALNDALQTLDVLLVDDYDVLADALPPVITYCEVLAQLALAQGNQENCYPTSEINEKFAQLDLFLEDKYDTAVFEAEYWQVEKEIFDLLAIGTGASELGADNASSILANFTELAEDLREAAWAYCVATRVQYPLWRQTGIAGLPSVDFDLNTVLQDIDHCGSTLAIEVFTTSDRKLEGQSRDFTFTDSSPGGADSASARSPVTGRILVSGDVLPLRCGRPLGAEDYGNDRLEIRLADAVLATLTRDGDRFFTEALTLDLADALAAAGVDPLDPPEEVRFEVWRVNAVTVCQDNDDVPDPMGTSITTAEESLVTTVAYAFDPAPVITSLSASPSGIPADESTTVTLSVGYRDAGENIVSPGGFDAVSGTGTIQETFTPGCQDEPYTLSRSVQLRDAFDQTSDVEDATISVSVDPACTEEPFEIVSISYDATIVSDEGFEEEGIVITLMAGPPPPYRIVVRPRTCPPGVNCTTTRDEEGNPPWDTNGFRCFGLEPGDDPIEFDYEILVESGWDSQDDDDYRATPPYPTPWTCLPPPG